MKFHRTLLPVLLLFLTFCTAAFAQDTASITGTVTDPSGAAVPNAKVTLTNPAQGVSRTVTTNGAGDYVFPLLPIGSYNVFVVAEGFKKYQAKGVKLDVAEKARVDVHLEVGAVTTEVIVEGADIAQVQTQSSDLGGTVTGKEVTQLELNGRDFKQLVTLVPGVSNQTGADEGGVGVTANNSFSVNGGRVEYNNWELDGGDNLDNGSNNTLNVTPSVDAIGEFKVLTSNYGAQYGKNGSGTIEVETKSGTNKFHGDAYEFVRNNIFNAPGWNQGGVSPSYHKNDFGYTVGGPLYIPKVYNEQKTKTFFFWSQEWRRDRVPYTFQQLVPTATERGGNFSDLCPATFSQFQTTDPSPAQGEDPYFGDCPGILVPNTTTGPNGVPVYNPYNVGGVLNQVVDPTTLANDPNAQALLSLIPGPTASFGNPTVPGSAFFYDITSQPTNWRQELLRVDHNITDKERVSFHYIHDSWDTVNQVPLWTNTGSFPTIQTAFTGPGISMLARLSSTFAPTLLNEFVFSYTTDHIGLTDLGDWQRPSGTTFGSIFPGADRGVMPGINLLDPAGVYGNFGEDAGYIPNGPYNSNPTYSFRDNLNKLVGKHNLQMGAYFQAVEKNELGGELAAGSYPGYITFNPGVAQTTTGNPFADLLVGDMASFGQQNTTVKYYNRYKMLEPYFQDDWHLTNHLTLNLGVRVSLFGTYREKEHQAFNFDPAHYVAGQTSVDPNTDIVTNLTADNGLPSVSDLPNGIVQCGVTPGVPVGCMKGHLFNPAPRVGFAWDPRGDGKTAIRGGYGIFYEHGNGNEANTESLENSPPLAYAAQQNNIVGYPNIGTGAAQPQFPLGVTAVPTKAQWPYMQQWHFDIQQEIARSTVASLSYVGSKGTRLTRETDLNQVLPTPPSQNPYKQGETYTGTECGSDPDAYSVPQTATTPSGVPIPYYVGANGIPYGPAVNVAIANGCVPAGADPFRPYPGYGDIANLQTASSSNYNALQFLLRRNAGGLDLSFAYTYSHSIDDSSDRYDGSFTNTYDPASNRASSNFDERQIFTASYIWDIPVFKHGGFTHAALGGWQVSGITNFNTGSPFSVIYNSIDNAGVGNGIGSSAYADVVGDPKAGVVQTPLTGFGQLFYNPAVYTTPTALTFGDSGRNSLKNPDFINFDMAVFKHFAIKESTAIEFRAEAFNVFNHLEWDPIAGQAGAGANINGSGTNILGSTGFLYAGGAHEARVLQFAMKFLF
ncbi:MAG TPA: carboxypeptidase regulatory-like domain-containing protein [Terriglobales bacterium]|nr:carboxypeptidase regulatory-like domain-containing protein [Terriglobales bacterium]